MQDPKRIKTVETKLSEYEPLIKMGTSESNNHYLDNDSNEVQNLSIDWGKIRRNEGITVNQSKSEPLITIRTAASNRTFWTSN